MYHITRDHGIKINREHKSFIHRVFTPSVPSKNHSESGSAKHKIITETAFTVSQRDVNANRGAATSCVLKRRNSVE